jgi:3-oxoacyl-(acyl-carrier-protein) synthase
MSRKVVVTGIGVICASGNNVEEFKRNMENGSRTQLVKLSLSALKVA